MVPYQFIEPLEREHERRDGHIHGEERESDHRDIDVREPKRRVF
jgi:hypothetical protein